MPYGNLNLNPQGVYHLQRDTNHFTKKHPKPIPKTLHPTPFGKYTQQTGNESSGLSAILRHLPTIRFSF